MKMMKIGPTKTLGRRPGTGYSHGLRERKKLYKTSRWQSLRTSHLATHPVCEFCKAEGRIVPAEIVDHIRGHQTGDWKLRFFDPSNLQSLCWSCHSR